MSDFYHDRSRELQDRYDTRRLADRIEERLVADRIGDADRAFIESRDMFFLATTDDERLAELLLQRRRSRVRARGRPAHDGVSQFRRQRHVPVDGQRAADPQGGTAVHRLRDAPAGCACPAKRALRSDDPLLAELPGGAIHRADRGDAGVSELPALHPPVHAGRALAVRAARRQRRRRCRTGKKATGRATSCRKTTPRETG